MNGVKIKMPVISPGVARIICMQPKDDHGDGFQGEVLLKSTLKSVILFGKGTHDHIKEQLKLQFPNCKHITNQEFLCELDHIKLFGEASDAQCWTPRENYA